MPVTKSQVKKILMSEEPDYSEAAQLGPTTLPYLEEFILGQDEALAAKAAYLVGLIQDTRVTNILIRATASENDLVRIAVAATAKYLKPKEASKILVLLVKDSRYGVRKMVLKSTPKKASGALVAKIKWMVRNDSEQQLRDKASEVLLKSSGIHRNESDISLNSFWKQ